MSEHQEIVSDARSESLPAGSVGVRVLVQLSGCPSSQWSRVLRARLAIELAGHPTVGHVRVNDIVQGDQIVLEGVEASEAPTLASSLRRAVDAANQAGTGGPDSIANVAQDEADAIAHPIPRGAPMSEPATDMCAFPGCERPAVRGPKGAGRPSSYCGLAEHNAQKDALASAHVAAAAQSAGEVSAARSAEQPQKGLGRVEQAEKERDAARSRARDAEQERGLALERVREAELEREAAEQDAQLARKDAEQAEQRAHAAVERAERVEEQARAAHVELEQELAKKRDARTAAELEHDRAQTIIDSEQRLRAQQGKDLAAAQRRLEAAEQARNKAITTLQQTAPPSTTPGEKPPR